MTKAALASAAALAGEGFDVVVDTVFERRDCLDASRGALAPYRTVFVAVTCGTDVLVARERARGDRQIGQALRQRDEVFHDADYDLWLDTGVETPAASAARGAALM